MVRIWVAHSRRRPANPPSANTNRTGCAGRCRAGPTSRRRGPASMRTDHDGQQKSQGVGDDEPPTPVDLLPRVVAAGCRRHHARWGADRRRPPRRGRGQLALTGLLCNEVGTRALIHPSWSLGWPRASRYGVAPKSSNAPDPGALQECCREGVCRDRGQVPRCRCSRQVRPYPERQGAVSSSARGLPGSRDHGVTADLVEVVWSQMVDFNLETPGHRRGAGSRWTEAVAGR